MESIYVNGCELAHYENGNHTVTLYSDGTKIKATKNPDDSYFTYDFPENFDIKINNRCNAGCAYCHEGSSKDGKVRSLTDLVKTKWYSSIKPGTEMAIGGGNIFESPDLVALLEANKGKGIISNITVNQAHFYENLKIIEYLIRSGLVNGVGLSLTNSRASGLVVGLHELQLSRLDKNIVIHTIAGILKPEDYGFLEGKKVLILGYKHLRRGTDFYNDRISTIDNNIETLKADLPLLYKKCKALSFDCLAIEQLNVQHSLGLSDEEWKLRFQGDDKDVLDENGNITASTMYIDWVENKVARMSTASLIDRFEIEPEDTIETLLRKSIKSW